MKFLVFAAAVAVAFGATRPQISEEFLAEVEVERHDHNEAIFGEGFLAHDQNGGKSAERYDLHPKRFHVIHSLAVQRLDTHKEYYLNSEDRHHCEERDFDGPLRAPFAWVANATYAGQVDHHGVKLDGWEARFGGVRLLLGVHADDVNTPVVFEREGNGDYIHFYFRHFNTTTPDAKFFEVPEECHHSNSFSLKDPTRPDVAETFIAATDIERHERGRAVFGEGFFAHNQPAQKAAERYDLHPEKFHNIHVLDLQRGDIHEEFSINSDNEKDCHKRNMTSPVYPVFEWVSHAHYRGEVKHHEVTLQAWELREGSSRLLLGVHPNDVNTPVIFERESTGGLTRVFFREFNATTPDDKFFEIPSECQQ